MSHHPKDPTRTPSRRQVIAGAIGSGFALAVRPVAADTITTDTNGLDAGDVRVPTSTGEIPVYRAMPAESASKGKKSKPPVVLVVQEIFGVHEHIKDVCRRLAKRGYFAVAPELFARQGDVSKLSNVDEIRKVVAKVPDAQVLVDLDATVAWANATGRADTAKLGIVGFCWGGRAAWLYAAHSTTLKAGVACYGKVTGEKDALHPRQPLDIGAALNAPVLGLYGGQDQGIPLASVEDMKNALSAGSKPSRNSRIHVYPKAGHAFLADYRPNYEPEAAADAWRRMLAWFKANGVG